VIDEMLNGTSGHFIKHLVMSANNIFLLNICIIFRFMYWFLFK